MFSLTVAGQAASENNLNEQLVKVVVKNALSDEGKISFAFFNKEGFRKTPIQAISSEIKNGYAEVTFKNIPEGEYAIICYHDENENGKMDFETNGMPKEDYGTSNNPMSFGPPQFDPSKFEVKNEALSLEIKF